MELAGACKSGAASVRGPAGQPESRAEAETAGMNRYTRCWSSLLGSLAQQQSTNLAATTARTRSVIAGSGVCGVELQGHQGQGEGREPVL